MLLYPVISTAQDFDSLMTWGKAEFKKKNADADYAKALEYFEQAVDFQPNNAEAHYLLGYSYSRFNSIDCSEMIQMEIDYTIKCSEEMEKVNKLTPKYNSEILISDPYSKLTGEWGAQAMCYLQTGKRDSVLWAFREGKKRGGFGEYLLALNRNLLDRCDSNSVLISSGDNRTQYLWYLQIFEEFRTDIAVVDIALLTTKWYSKYLQSNKIIDFGISIKEIDTLNYCKWQDSTITIDDFSWVVKPQQFEKYISAGDRLFLSFLLHNKFKRSVYLTLLNAHESLSLDDYFQNLYFANRINPTNLPPLDFDDAVTELTIILKMTPLINMNSFLEIIFVQNIRAYIFNIIYNNYSDNNYNEWKLLFELHDRYIPESTFPIEDEKIRKWVISLRSFLEKY